MQVGERVYAQKTAPHEWYKAYIIEIRPAKRVRTCIDMVTCCSKLPMEYVVMYEDQTTQIVNIGQISERL
tara:strand:- start:700 stop:909 length:210 start_codon:yes stop_codon:yes gene_type:complete